MYLHNQNIFFCKRLEPFYFLLSQYQFFMCISCSCKIQHLKFTMVNHGVFIYLQSSSCTIQLNRHGPKFVPVQNILLNVKQTTFRIVLTRRLFTKVVVLTIVSTDIFMNALTIVRIVCNWTAESGVQTWIRTTGVVTLTPNSVETIQTCAVKPC